MHARRSALAFVSLVTLAATAPEARAEDCRCLAVAGDLTGALQAEIARADGLFSRGDFAGALAIYVQGYTSSKAPVLLYAQAMATWQLGQAQEARALFQAYLDLGGDLPYRDRAERGLRDLGGRITGTVTGAVGATGGLVGGLTGSARGGVDGDVGGAVGTVGAVGADVTGRIDANAKPPKIAKGAAIVLGVVAIAAIGAVGIHAIAAGLKDDISLDAKFDLGLGLTGVTVGVTALYVGSLTAATGAVAGAGSLRCQTLPKHKPLVAPVAMPGGGGLVTAMSF